MTEQANRWEGVYRTKADTEVSWFEPRPQKSLDLIKLTRIGKKAAIVDVGAGASHLVDCLIEAGYAHITLLDLSASALQAVRARLPDGAPVEFVAGDVLAWEPTRQFDIWHDRAAFHFLTNPEDQARYVSVMTRALFPGGFAIIGTFAIDGPERCSGLPVVRYDAETLAARLGPDFRLVDSSRHEHVTPGGSVQRFHFGVFQKR